ncbi:TIGR03619 family F420-dependent LLM class oxidoreductase [Nocardioides alpinus]|uniref:TIGR03619 family F420-dependent LLM class oxidoreductase n=2 Tax=Nocardioides alpinus TaxID=748909 RepID=A0ABX4QZ68_9ACTN|nr:TIGR03619 family F420-dependent LLM class oxidoreductase [Nocardioides alpinus]PKH42223.1 TIGR03619 family F420-dependent LLM class oxidoreductase [Nocardioides alpinus]
MSEELPLLGFGLPVSGSWATPGTMIHLARRAEDLGYASLWTFQRMLQPQPVADGPGPAHDEVGNPSSRPISDPSYSAVHDAMLPLAFVAGHTRRIGLGTATLCAPFTPPVLMAKAMTTLDHLSGGRVTAGLGIGWMSQEYAAAGVPMARRGARMEEYLRCLRAVWTEDPVEFAGEFYTVPRSHVGPRPVQQPHPPVLVGGEAEPALRRAGRLAEGWIGSTRTDLASLTRAVALVRAGAEEAGRDPDAVRILVRMVVDLVAEDPGRGRRRGNGTRQQVLDDLADLASHGATEVLVDLNFSPHVGSPDVDADAATAEAERVLDALAPSQPPPHLRRPPPSA